MATGRGKEVDSRFTCTICFEPYRGREAKILPCFHTFCLPCLAGLVARGETPQTSGLGDTAEEGRQCDSLTCPTCRTVIPLPPRGVTGFQRNFYLDSVSGEADSGAVACTVCEADQTAQFLCGQCHNHVCCQCRRSHDKCCQGSQLTPLTPPSPSSAAQSVAQSMIQSVAQSTAQSVAQSTVQSTAQSMIQSAAQSTAQSMTQSAAQSTAQSNAVMSSAQASPRNLNDLYQKVEDLAGQVTSLQSANTHLTQHVTLLSSAHSKLSTEHSALQREVTSLREKNDQLTSGQASLQREVRALRDKQAIAHQDLAVLTAEKDKACAGLAKLQTDILSMQTDASLQQTDILRLKADHGQVAAKLSAVQIDTKALQGGEASVKKEVDQLKTDCGQLMADKATIQTKLSSLDQLTSTIQGMMSNLESRFATANTQVGFTAGLTQIVTTSKEQTLVCGGIATNEGGGYDGHTGVFTAPVTGTYCFLVTTSPDDRDVKKAALLIIVVDGERKGGVYSEGMSRSTGHTVVKLTCGQKVWLKSWGGWQFTFGGGCTRFSGMLLQAEV
ncbi:hypothetical protein ACOMHN_048941 [Nucella lapillus]